MDCGMKCIKVLLGIFNFILIVIGIALICVGSIAVSSEATLVQITTATLLGAGITLIVVGFLIFLTAALGFAGLCKENHCLTMTYAVLLVIIILIQLAAGITGFVMKDKVSGYLGNTFKAYMLSYKDGSKQDKQFIDQMQITSKCCGSVDFRDWQPVLGNKVPKSCCLDNTSCVTSYTITQTSFDFYTAGCITTYGGAVKNHLYIMGIVALVFCFFEIIGVIFACCLAREIRHEYTPVG